MPKKLIAVLLTLLMVCYPFAVMWAIQHDQLFLMSGLLIAVAVIRFFLSKDQIFLPLTIFTLLCGTLTLLLQNALWLKFYPVLMSLGSASVFAYTLIRPPTMIERFARLHQPDLPESGVRWTRQVTKVWCGFLVLNALVALSTVFLSTQIWAVYNGFISYVLMGILLLGEFVLRRRHQQKELAHKQSQNHNDNNNNHEKLDSQAEQDNSI